MIDWQSESTRAIKRRNSLRMTLVIKYKQFCEWYREGWL